VYGGVELVTMAWLRKEKVEEKAIDMILRVYGIGVLGKCGETPSSSDSLNRTTVYTRIGLIPKIRYLYCFCMDGI
jgi:hypothetical protein